MHFFRSSYSVAKELEAKGRTLEQAYGLPAVDYDAWRQHIRAWALANIGNDEAVEQNRQLFMNLDAA